MNDDRNRNADRPRSTGDNNRERTLEALLRLAGPSDQIPDDIRARVYASARAELRQSARLAPLRRWVIPVALAASLVIVALAIQPDAAVQPRLVGSVVMTVGTASADGDAIRVGDVIDTAAGSGLSIELNNGTSLRVDEETVLKVESIKTFNLVAGRIYVDTGDRIYPRRMVTIRTPSGTATDVGTQFSVRYERATMSVAVREGRVDLSDSGESYAATRGDKISLRPGMSALVEQVPVSGPTWDWAVGLAPRFELEDSSLLEFLKWASREAGLELEFADAGVMTESMSAKLHGSIDGLSPEQAIQSVLATTSFDYVIDGDRLVISKQK